MADWVKNLAPNMRIETINGGPRLRSAIDSGVVILRRLTREEFWANCVTGTKPEWAVEGVNAAIWNGWPCMIEFVIPRNPFNILKEREE